MNQFGDETENFLLNLKTNVQACLVFGKLVALACLLWCVE